MGIFGRKKQKSYEPPTTVDADTGIDFAKYELELLGADIQSIIDVPGALRQALKFIVGIPVVVAIVTWAVFSSRMSSVALVPFTIIAFMLSLFGAALLAGFFVARRRLNLVADASNRVVDVIGEMHADAIRVKEGNAETSVQQVAIGLLENAIFPAAFGTLTTTAETAMGPLGRFSSSIAKAPTEMVQKSVISAIKSLPDKELGEIVTDIGESLPSTAASVERITTEYAQARDKVEGIVSTVSKTALGSTLGFALVASVPLFGWLILGWLLS